MAILSTPVLPSDPGRAAQYNNLRTDLLTHSHDGSETPLVNPNSASPRFGVNVSPLAAIGTVNARAFDNTIPLHVQRPAADPVGSLYALVDNAGTAGYLLNDSSQPADGRLWGMEVSSGLVRLSTYSDIGGSATMFSVDRSGNAVLTGGLTTSLVRGPPAAGLPLSADGSVTVMIDADNNDTTRLFAVQANGGGNVFTVSEVGNVLASGSLSVIGTTALQTGVVVTGNASVSGALVFPANGGPGSGAIYRTAVNGLVVQGITGSTNDLALTNNANGLVLSVPAGTVNVALGGNLVFGATGQRITGDFSNGTHGNRVLFQTSTAGGNTVVGAISNGAGTASALNLYAGSDPANAAFVSLTSVTGSQHILTSGHFGSGVTQPLALTIDGATLVRLHVSQGLSLLDGTDPGAGNVRIAGNLGLGATPQAWAAGYRALDLGSGISSLMGGNSANPNTWLFFNTYYDGLFKRAVAGQTGTVQLGSNGLQVYTDASGSVGTFTPTERLRVDTVGTATFIANGTAIYNQTSRNTNAAGLSGAIWYRNDSASYVGLEIFGSSYAGNGLFGQAGAGSCELFSSAVPLYVGTYSAHSLVLATNATPRLTIGSTGNVNLTGLLGIGSSTHTNRGVRVSIASGAVVYLTGGAVGGLLIIHNDSGLYTALYLISAYGTTATELSDPASQFANSAAANQIGIYWDGGAGNFVIRNGYATAQVIDYLFLASLG